MDIMAIIVISLFMYFVGTTFFWLKIQRTSDRDAADGSKEELERLVRQIREMRWPDVKIMRYVPDSGFCRNNLMSWCESNDVKYIFWDS